MAPVRTVTRSLTHATTPRDGSGIIYRTNAVKKYRVAPADLDSILPVEIRPNSHGGRNETKIYNVADVEALAARLATGNAESNSTYNPSTPTKMGTRATPTTPRLSDKKPGGKILRTKAMKEYGLKGTQLDRILPISVEDNPHGYGNPMRYYNLCDVTALQKSVQVAAASPSKLKGTPKCSHYSDDAFYQDGIYDGMSSEAAAVAFCRHTGIAPSWAFGTQDV